MDKDIALLRYALASILTELDREKTDEEMMEDVATIAQEALDSTKQYRKGKDLTLDGIGIEGWRDYLARRT